MLELKRHRFTLAEYDRMAAAGVIDECERVELIDGDFIVMSPIGSPHATAVRRLNYLLSVAVLGKALVDVQNPLAIDVHNVPQPDLMVLRQRTDFYADEWPHAADVLLLIEVSDTSWRFDRSVKLPMYSHAGVNETWLLDLQHGELLVHTEPQLAGYGVVRTFRRGDSVRAQAFPELQFEVAALLG